MPYNATTKNMWDKLITMSYYQDIPGMVEPGNINLANRPKVYNLDGTVSTELSMSFNDGGVEVLIPTVVNGSILEPEDAIKYYYSTGQHLGKFESPDMATEFALKLHKRFGGK